MSHAAAPLRPPQASIAGQIAIVTGAGRGIGQAIVRALAHSGVTVIAASRTREDLDQTVAVVTHEGGTVHAQTVDVTDQSAVNALVDAVLSEFGQIDVLVNNAGSFAALGPVWEADPALWLRDLTTNLYGTFLCTRAVLPAMIARRQGVIINMSGGGAAEPAPFYSGYASSKAGILRLTDSLAAEVAPHNIVVYALAPGLVRTAMTEALMQHPHIRAYNPGFADAMAADDTVPPEWAGRLAVFLAAVRDPRLSGRTVDVSALQEDASDRAPTGSDGLSALMLQAEQIEQGDLYTLRLRL